MTRARVAYVLRTFPKLSETFILNEILAVRAAGVPVRVFALERSTERRLHPEAARLLPEVTFVPAVNGGGVARVPERHRRWARAGAWLAPALRRWGATHVHAHFAGPAATAAALASRATGLPFSFTAHAKDIFAASVDWDWLRTIAGGASAVVTVCEYNRRFLRRRLPGVRIVRVYNGVDLDAWRPAARRPSLGPVLAVGRLVRKKGLHVLLEALAQLRQHGTPLSAVIVGDGVEGDALRAQARALRLGRLVRFTGALTQPEVRSLLRRARAVVLPCIVDHDGNQDALPTVLIEAAACGVPVVATRVAGIPEIVRDGVTGVLVAAGDAAALARALRRVAASPRLNARMGRAARARAESRFDGRRAVTALSRVFATATQTTLGMEPARDARRSVVL